MNVSGKRQMLQKRWLLVALFGALLSLACGAKQTPAGAPTTGQTFVYAPPVGLVFKHEMKQLDELTIPGSNFRDSEEWRIVWEVKIEEASDKFQYRRRLVELGLNVNGEQILKGSEVEPRRAEILQVMSKDGQLLDVTGTEQLTAAIASLVPEPERAVIAAQFSPERLRAVLGARAVDAFSEVVGKPADVGATWTAQGTYGALRAKKVVVDSALDCRGSSCRKLVRSFDIDQQMVGEAVRQKVGAYLKERGWDPAAVKVVDSKLKVEDYFVAEPATCLFHDAQLAEQGSIVLEGPAGGRLEFARTSKFESHADYPPAQ
jgi:hypothetical protein